MAGGGGGCGRQQGLPAPKLCHRKFLGFGFNLATVLGAVLGLGENFRSVACGQIIASKENPVQPVLIAPVTKLRKCTSWSNLVKLCLGQVTECTR